MTFDEAVTIMLSSQGTAVKTHQMSGYLARVGIAGQDSVFGIAFRYRSTKYPFTNFPVFPVTMSESGDYVVGSPSQSTAFSTELVAQLFSDDWYTSTVSECEEELEKISVYEGLKLTLDISYSGASGIRLVAVGNPDPVSLEYSRDGHYWLPYQVGSTVSVPSIGDGVYFRTTLTSGATLSMSENDYYRFERTVSSSTFALSGNVMSLLDKNMTRNDVPSYSFYKLFQTTASSYFHLYPLLPATQLGSYCYAYMFSGVSIPYGSTSYAGPSLPATTLAPHCYEGMFEYSSMETISLPATVMADYCYAGMFSGGAYKPTLSSPSFSIVGGLKATTLAPHCYDGMFRNCGNALTSTIAMSASTMADSCCKNMYSGCVYLTSTQAMKTSLAPRCYQGMFSGCTALTSAPSVGATTLAESCYEEMFLGCTSLTRTPALPASTHAIKCYKNMFSGCTRLSSYSSYSSSWRMAESSAEGMFRSCTSLVSMPTVSLSPVAVRSCKEMFCGCTSLTSVLPQLVNTALFESCYEGMFKNTKIGTIPSLPSTSMAKACYKDMFSGCTSATMYKSSPVVAATSLAEECFKGMFSGCTGLTTATALPVTTLAKSCYESMFYGCTGLIAAPALPATTLVESCYSGMFSGCSSMASLTVSFTLWDSAATASWMDGVSASGQFSGPYQLGFDDTMTRSASTVPSGWTVTSTGTYPGLCFTAVDAGSTVSIPCKYNTCDGGEVQSFDSILYYSTSANGSSWSTWSRYSGGSAVTLSAAGNRVMFRATSGGNHAVTRAYGYYDSSETRVPDHITVTGRVTASGNVMSLLDASLSKTDLDRQDDTFHNLFYGCSGLSVSSLGIPVVSATKPNNYENDICSVFGGMFYGCSSITTIPKLDFTTNCTAVCSEMFYGCTSLTGPSWGLRSVVVGSRTKSEVDIPEDSSVEPDIRIVVSSTSCDSGCYRLFGGCTGMRTTPIVKVESMPDVDIPYPDSRYRYSFGFCEKMFEGCTALRCAYLPSTHVAKNGYFRMFNGCGMSDTHLDSGVRSRIRTFQSEAPSSSVSYQWLQSSQHWYGEGSGPGLKGVYGSVEFANPSVDVSSVPRATCTYRWGSGYECTDCHGVWDDNGGWEVKGVS